MARFHTIEIPIPALTTIEVEIDLADHLDELELETDDILAAVCHQVSPMAIVAHMELESFLALASDEQLLALVRDRPRVISALMRQSDEFRQEAMDQATELELVTTLHERLKRS